jgi:hypothetical protein
VPDPKSTPIEGEQRDTERAVTLWRQRAAEFRGIPPITAFDFSRIATDLGYRFVISCDEVVEDAAFLLYGTQFAQRLGLPDRADSFIPLLQQLPERYRSLFAEGCSESIHQREPSCFSDSVSGIAAVELYRAVFIPVKLRPSSSRPVIYGSFNFRSVPQVRVPNERVPARNISDELEAFALDR